MKRISLLVALALAVLLPASAISAAPSDHDHQIVVTLEESASVAGGLPMGVHPDYFGIAGVLGTEGQCTSDPTAYCESVFIEVSNPLTQEEIDAGVESKRENLDIVLTPTHPVADFDLVLFASNADGDVLGNVGQDGAAPIVDDPDSKEYIFQSVTTTEANPSRYFVAHIVYFAAPSDYTLDVTLT